MNRKLAALFLLAALPACRRVSDKSESGDQPVVPIAPATAADAAPRPKSAHKPLLWEAVSPGGARSHLLGTMHLGFDYEDLPPVVWERFGQSTTVVLELDLRQMSPAVMEDRTKLPPGQSLRAMLGEPTWQKLKESAAGIPDEYLDRMQPWIAMQLVLARLYPTVLPLDLAVLRDAEKARKQLVFLETPEFQIAMAAEITDAAMVRDMVDDSSEGRGLLSRLVDAYRAGDYEEVSRIALDPANYTDRPEVVDRVINARNRDWVPKLAPLLQRGGVFVAVGAAHMVGDHGLLKAFADQGYRVTRVAP